jgi:membrane protease YdiL (CAAX protease family)
MVSVTARRGAGNDDMNLDPTRIPGCGDSPRDGEPNGDHPQEDLTAILNDLTDAEATDATLLGIPMARPVDTAAPFPTVPAYGPTPSEPPLSRLRAVLEMILVLPAAFGGFVVFLVATILAAPSDERWLNITSHLGMGFVAALACMFLVRQGRRSLATIGWTGREFAVNILIGFAALLITYVLLMMLGLALVVIRPELLNQPPEAQKAIEENFPRLPAMAGLLVFACVAFYEEVVFRGFLLTRLQAILRRWWLTVPIGSLAFGLLHGYEGGIAMIVTSILGLIMALLFVWRKSLVPCMTLHLVHNFLIFQVLQTFSKTWT